MGYWIVELSNGKTALITDDLFFRHGTPSEETLHEVKALVEESLSKVCDEIFGEWRDLLDPTGAE
ncbi:hypothetical protein C8P63_10496 [Melghirimyces profundicolus]|uniref:Uncharacterized protein n=1 Tax=Melghirimyces profundicolus TaxID=1242148 RepID=A0A2T6C4K4_9BACL|nr:hypothetical protein [Melghirimyces profundicolus]PTX63251.1 hypothetical protein C8P63_10496 [Melghirimyces profundicolus]